MSGNQPPSAQGIVVSLTALGLLVSVLSGGLFVGTMRQTVVQNERAIAELEVAMQGHIAAANMRITDQERLKETMRSNMIKIETVLERLSTDVRALASFVDETRARQLLRLERLEDERNGIRSPSSSSSQNPSSTRSGSRSLQERN